MTTPSPEAMKIAWRTVWRSEELAYALDAFAAEARAKAFEDAAQVAERYADNPASGDNNNTQAAFYAGMDHRAGAIDNALCIRDAIRALAKPQDDTG